LSAAWLIIVNAIFFLAMLLYIACMFRATAILLLSIFSLSAQAQKIIKGKVVNAETGAPVPGSSVFVTNTSKGTTADSNGQFELTDVPAGKHELVISSIGYETNVFSFSDDQLPLLLKVVMHIKVKELSNVTVEPSLEEGWNKWGKMFSDNFIGTTDNSMHCRIKNTDAIKFRFFKKSNRVIAYADEPLVIENKALGYTIRYQLENFEVNFKEKTTFFLGYSLFEDQTKEGKEPKNKWERRRDEAYKGSTMHFMQSLYNNRIKEEGFEVRRMVRTPNYEKERIRKLYSRSKTLQTEKMGGMTIKVTGPTIDAPADSISYYERILQQEDVIDTYGPDIIGADSLVVKSEGLYKVIYFDNYLYITYKKELEEGSYLKHIWQTNRRPAFQRSHVFLVNENPITVDQKGNYYNPQDFFTSGYWGWSEKISNLLPIDYELRGDDDVKR
jgi:hypothetical protein